MGELSRVATFPFVAAVLVALLVIALGIQQTANRKTSVQPVKQAMIGGTEAKHQGPWPVCVGISGKDCQHLIESYAEDVRGHVFIIDPDMVVSTDFDTTRVLIWVDESGIVAKIPKRG